MEKESSFARYLRHRREQRGFSINQLAAEADVSGAQISRIENGHRGVPKPDTIEKLASALSIPYEEMMTAAGYMKAPELPRKSLSELKALVAGIQQKPKEEQSPRTYSPQFTFLPVIGTIKAGYDLYADQQVIERQIIDQEEVPDGEYFYLVVKGDSMIEDRIMDGDRVLVRRQDYVENGQIAVVLINNDEATLKRVFYQDNDLVVLQASNRHIPPRVFPVKDVLIQGQVVKVEFDIKS